MTITPKGDRIPTIADAKTNKKRLVEEMKLRLIEAKEWGDTKQFQDEKKLNDPHNKTESAIASERKAIRERQDVINAEIDALATLDEVQAYRIEF